MASKRRRDTSELEASKRLRRVCFNQTTKIAEDIELHGENWSKIQISIKISLLESYFSKFDVHQSNIEEVGEEHESDMRSRFEEIYASLKEKLLLLESRQTPNETSIPSIGTTFSNNINRYKSLLPSIQLPKFDGSYTKWTEFINTFEVLIGNDQNLSTIEKFQMLKSNLTGSTLNTINALECNGENYKKALELLKQRFDNKRLIFGAHINKLLHITPASRVSVHGLRELVDCVKAETRALQTLGNKEEIADGMLINIISSKLDNITRNKWEENASFNQIPKWNEFVEFLQNRCQTLEYVQESIQRNSETTNNTRRREHNSKLSVNHSSNYKKRQCLCCNACEDHSLHKCPKYLKLHVRERYNMVKRLQRCINCLKSGHNLKSCSSSSCALCSKRHHTTLHFDNQKSSYSSVSNLSGQHGVEISNSDIKSTCLTSSSYVDTFQQIIIATALVEVISKTGQCLTCRVLLDSASQSNFITEKMVQQLSLDKVRSEFTIVGVNSSKTKVKHKTTFKIHSKYSSFEMVTEALILSKITSELPSTAINISGWQIPNDVYLADPNFHQPARIDVLLGAEAFIKFLCVGQIDIGKGGPSLQKTVFGWVVSGKVKGGEKSYKGSSNVVSNTTIEQSNGTIDKLIRKFWEIEELQNDTTNLSPEEKRCEEFFNRTTVRDATGRFIVRLPMRENPETLGNSEEHAKKRLSHLEKRFAHNNVFKIRYYQFMKEYNDLGHMEPYNEDACESNTYFMPHHGIDQMSNNTLKLRVVFDASCRTSTGLSLNDILMVGPKVQNDLFSVLCRFRTRRFVFSADIIKMYRQILVDPEDTKLQLILWRDQNTQRPKAYRLKTVTYGTACAPYLAIRCLQQLSTDNSTDFPEGAEALKNDLYVDDILTGTDSIKSLIELKRQLVLILKSAGMELHKRCSNTDNIRASLNSETRSKSITTPEVESVKTLGINWIPVEDKFLFQLNHMKSSKRITKRSVLSIIASFFDPLRLINPVIVLAKTFMQELWKQKLQWYESIPIDLHLKWEKFLSQLNRIPEIQVHRYVLTPGDIDIQLDGFCDASQSAYGACIFLRVLDNKSCVHSNLLCAKSRVASVKTISIARLELCAALLLVELVDKVLLSLPHYPSSIHCWTDSTITLSWINALPSSWNIFVAHRVTKIQAVAEKYSIKWRHVRSIDNPADILSRGALPEVLVNNHMWFFGPDFLKYDEQNWPSVVTPEPTDLERRNYKNTLISICQPDAVELSKFISSFISTRRVFSYVYRFIQRCKHRTTNDDKTNSNSIASLSVKEMKGGMMIILKIIQNSGFTNELRSLKKGKSIPKGSKILNLNPFIDDHGLIRVGGRLQNSNLQYEMKHPLLLPRNHRFTRALVEHIHKENMHAGLQSTSAIIRQQFWIPNCRQLVRSVIHNCLICFRSRPVVMKQIMGILPPSRVQPPFFPFLNTGVDYCGPFMIKQFGRGRSPMKAYIALFICFSTKAVHLELVTNLTTEAFIAALKRFFARRGKCQKITSDNATNFVGAKRELAELKAVCKYCREQGIEWEFIPPRSPHFGGLWEASVKRAKFHLTRTFGLSSLNYEQFTTVVVQIEGILNSRPLTPLSSDANDLEALTPSHFLIGRQSQTIPEPDVTHIQLNHLSMWQHISRLQQLFWKRWSKEYLTTLQERQKWKTQAKNVKIGTMVLMRDDQLSPSVWPLGRIIKLIAGDDNNVRVVDVKTVKGIFRRSIHQLCPLPLDTETPTVEVPSRRGACSSSSAGK